MVLVLSVLKVLVCVSIKPPDDGMRLWQVSSSIGRASAWLIGNGEVADALRFARRCFVWLCGLFVFFGIFVCKCVALCVCV